MPLPEVKFYATFGGKDFEMVFGFFLIPWTKIHKNEAELLVVGPNFEGNFHHFVSLSTLSWSRHLSVILKLLLHT